MKVHHLFGRQGKVCLFFSFQAQHNFYERSNFQEDEEDDKEVTGEKEAVVRCEGSAHILEEAAGSYILEEAAHKRNQIGLFCLPPPTCHVWAAIYLQRKRSRDPQSWNNTNPPLKLLPSPVTYCPIHNHHSHSSILRTGSNIGATNCEADATRPFLPDFDNVFRNIERWECAVLFP